MAQKDAYIYTDKLKEALIKTGQVIIVSKKFKEINDNSERVKFLENLLKEHKIIPEDGKSLRLSKQNAVADALRTRGNQYYANRKFLDALEAYNQSLCTAEVDSEAVGLAFANRSAVYFEMKLYDKCLKNIQLAKDNKYPMKNIDKIKKREEQCLEMINNQLPDTSKPIGVEFLKMKCEPNQKIPFIANCLKLKSDAQFGRYVMTDQPLKAGDVVAIEEPFCKVLLANHRFKYCATCLSDNLLDLIPCHECTSTMFCSTDCLKNGIKIFHQYECPVIDKLNILSTKIMRMAVRTFFEGLDVCDGNLEVFEQLMKNNQGSKQTIYDFDFTDNQSFPSKRKNILLAIDALAANEAERSQSDLFQRSGICAILMNLFMKHSNLGDLLANEKHLNFFRQFIFKQTQIAACNYHGISYGIMRKDELEENPQYGSGSYPFCSLINHSCAPNLVRVSFECKKYVVINRPIPAGGQLFDNYGFHHCLEDFQQRQTSLLTYMFKCSCEACSADFPLYGLLRTVDRNFNKFLKDDIDRLMVFDTKRAKERFYAYCEYLNKYDNNYPCREVSSIQECLLRCFTIFTMTDFKLKLCAN